MSIHRLGDAFCVLCSFGWQLIYVFKQSDPPFSDDEARRDLWQSICSPNG